MSNIVCLQCNRLLSTLADFAHRDCPGYTGHGDPLDGIPTPMMPADPRAAAEALKRCPFCGGEARRPQGIDTPCGCLACDVWFNGPNSVAAWNRRAALAAPEPRGTSALHDHNAWLVAHRTEPPEPSDEEIARELARDWAKADDSDETEELRDVAREQVCDVNAARARAAEKGVGG